MRIASKNVFRRSMVQGSPFKVDLMSTAEKNFELLSRSPSRIHGGYSII